MGNFGRGPYKERLCKIMLNYEEIWFEDKVYTHGMPDAVQRPITITHLEPWLR